MPNVDAFLRQQVAMLGSVTPTRSVNKLALHGPIFPLKAHFGGRCVYSSLLERKGIECRGSGNLSGKPFGNTHDNTRPDSTGLDAHANG